MVLFPGSLCRSKQIHTLARWHVLASTWSASLVMNFGSEHAHTRWLTRPTQLFDAHLYLSLFLKTGFYRSSLNHWSLIRLIYVGAAWSTQSFDGYIVPASGYVVPLQCSFLLLATSNWFDLVCLWILRKLKPNGWPQRMHPRGGVFHGNPPRKPSTLIHSDWTFSRIFFGNASSLSCLWLSRCPVAKSWRCSNISGSVQQCGYSVA